MSPLAKGPCPARQIVTLCCRHRSKACYNYSIIVIDQSAHELQVSTPVPALIINDLALVTPAEVALSLPDAIMQTNLGSTKSGQNISVSWLQHMFLTFFFFFLLMICRLRIPACVSLQMPRMSASLVALL